MENKKNNSSLKNLLKSDVLKSDSDYLKYSGLGLQLAAVIIIFLFAGIWLDSKFNTKFVFTLVLTLAGFFGGFYSFYLSIQSLMKKKKSQNNKISEPK